VKTCIGHQFYCDWPIDSNFKWIDLSLHTNFYNDRPKDGNWMRWFDFNIIFLGIGIMVTGYLCHGEGLGYNNR
jgi:hypothetical protein